MPVLYSRRDRRRSARASSSPSTVEEARRLSGRTIRVQFAQPVETIALPPGMTFLTRTPDTWTVKAETEIGVLVSLLAHLPIRDLEITEPALEDVLRSFYRADET